MQVSHERHSITSDVAEDPVTAGHVASFLTSLGEKVKQKVGMTAAPLDGRFHIVRTQETNLGNLVADIMRHSFNTDPAVYVQAAFFNSGSLRSDRVHSRGDLMYRDLVDMLPYMDETSIVEMSGTRLLQVLENAVSMYPKLEGRFLQVCSQCNLLTASAPPLDSAGATCGCCLGQQDRPVPWEHDDC
jgi:5'-nucleotidase